MGFIVGLGGIVVVLLGVFFILAAAMPAFGGRNDPVKPLAFGAVLLIAGASLLVYAGSWL